MQIIYRRCAGLDVHEKSVSACIRIVKGKQVETVEATFPTFTEDLEQLRDWLIRNRIQRVAMESTGVYWRPVWNITGVEYPGAAACEAGFAAAESAAREGAAGP
jgi:transposase